LITITELFYVLIYHKGSGLGKFDHNNRMITLSVITLSGFHCNFIFSEPNSEIVTAALQGAPPAPPGSHGGNGGGPNKPPMFRGGGMANNGTSLQGAQPPGLPPTMGGGGRFPTNGEQRPQPPIGHNVAPPGMPPVNPGNNKWPVNNAARPVSLKDKVR
jgi:hypothetical protein